MDTKLQLEKNKKFCCAIAQQSDINNKACTSQKAKKRLLQLFTMKKQQMFEEINV